jgi:hypothetical protein
MVAPVFASDNVCFIGAVETAGNQAFSVGIGVRNADTLGGFQIPFSFEFGISTCYKYVNGTR